MNTKKLLSLVSAVLAVAVLLTACAPSSGAGLSSFDSSGADGQREAGDEFVSEDSLTDEESVSGEISGESVASSEETSVSEAAASSEESSVSEPAASSEETSVSETAASSEETSASESAVSSQDANIDDGLFTAENISDLHISSVCEDMMKVFLPENGEPISACEDYVKEFVKDGTIIFPLNQYQFDALVSFANGEGYAHLKNLVAGRTAESIAEGILKYNKTNGIVLDSMKARRQAERNLFLSQLDKLDVDIPEDYGEVEEGVFTPKNIYNAHISSDTVEMIKKFTGYTLKAFKDVDGQYLIGYKHRDASSIDTLNDEPAAARLLEEDLVTYEKYVKNLVSSQVIAFSINQNQYDALVSFAHGEGYDTLKQLVLNKTANEVAEGILNYNKSGGVVSTSLTKRRTAERNLFLSQTVEPEYVPEYVMYIDENDFTTENIDSASTSSAGIDIIKKYTGCKLKAYKNTAGIYTIGYGHQSGVRAGDTLKNTEEAIKLLKEDLVKCENYVKGFVKDGTIEFALNQNKFDALVSFAYENGRTNLKQLVRGRNVGQVAAKIEMYNKSGGIVLDSLKKRRAEERKLFES